MLGLCELLTHHSAVVKVRFRCPVFRAQGALYQSACALSRKRLLSFPPICTPTYPQLLWITVPVVRVAGKQKPTPLASERTDQLSATNDRCERGMPAVPSFGCSPEIDLFGRAERDRIFVPGFNRPEYYTEFSRPCQEVCPISFNPVFRGLFGGAERDQLCRRALSQLAW